jgi:lipoprotein-anchoring transpeptidase ErfK/SrfK
MQRVIACALLAGAFGIAPALAEPMSLFPDRYNTTGSVPQHAQRAYRAPAPYVAPYAEQAPAARYASNEPQQAMGGGFIEFLFGGGRPVAPPRPPGDMYAYGGPVAAPVEPVARERPPVDPIYDRQVVPYTGTEKPGTIVIDTPQRFLYLVQDNGTAVRYGIGVGRPGFTWAGVKTVSAKKEWPDWTPPPEMLQRQPDLPTWMAGGPNNPLGARALYLGSSLYRIHGSNEPWTIGQAVSSGCIRMRNEDVVDLYERVRVGARVIVI